MAPQVDLYNTPGAYYALAYWCSSMVFAAAVRKERPPFYAYIGQVLLLAFLIVFMTVTKDVPKTLFVVCVTVDFLIGCLNLYLGCGMPARDVFYYGMRAFMVGELSAALDWQLFYWALTTLRMPLNMKTNLTFMLPTYILVFSLVFFAERTALKRSRLPDTGGFVIPTLALILISFYFLSNISYALRGTAFTTDRPQELFIIRTLADLAAVGISFAFHESICQMTARIEQEKLNQVLEMQYAAYKISEESIALVNRKYHDLKHQITYLKQTSDEAERRDRLEKMEREISVFEARTHCGNEVLDALLGTKILECQRKEAEFHVMADGQLLSFMDKMDVSALFGNLLDNAIEGVMKLEDPKERQIRLRVEAHNSFLRILCTNRFRGSLQFENGIPLTSKDYEKGYHGFGVRSIREIAERYGGQCAMKAADGWFRVSILIPLPSHFANGK